MHAVKMRYNHAMPKPTNLRQQQADLDRQLLIGFFAILFIIGGALIFFVYGTGAAFLGTVCFAFGAVLVGAVMLVMLGLQRLSDWLEERE